MTMQLLCPTSPATRPGDCSYDRQTLPECALCDGCARPCGCSSPAKDSASTEHLASHRSRSPQPPSPAYPLTHITPSRPPRMNTLSRSPPAQRPVSQIVSQISPAARDPRWQYSGTMTADPAGRYAHPTISGPPLAVSYECLAPGAPLHNAHPVQPASYTPATLLQPCPALQPTMQSQTLCASGVASTSFAPWTALNQATLAPPASLFAIQAPLQSLPCPMVSPSSFDAWAPAVQAASHDPLPRFGAPARPSHAQRLHARRVHPFPPRHQLQPVRATNHDRQRTSRDLSSGMALQQLVPQQLCAFPPPPFGAGPCLCSVLGGPSGLAALGLPAGQLFYPNPPAAAAPNLVRRPDQLIHAGVSFTVLLKLGEGSAGRVVLAENQRRLFAIKVIHPRRAKRVCTHRANFLREKEIMIRIGLSGSRFLVPLLMSWEEDGLSGEGRIFFVMPFCPIDMHVALKMGHPMTLNDRYLYCQELVSALCDLRRLGIVHRDIKPGNILIHPKGHAVLADFGMAQAIPADTFESWRRDAYSGTYAYMAPEMVQVSGARYGSVVDVWSMGLAFLEILRLVGRRYFTAESLDDIRREHAQKLPIRFNVPAEVNPYVAAMIAGMLHMDPNARLTARELQRRYVDTPWWSAVRNGTAVHDWIPSIGLLRKPPAGRCLEFLTFRASEDVMARVDATHFGADTSEFEYRAMNVFA
ncbi:kinase-like domain-containing protein [Daedaleopsis nitida]|nr:kinase-like domain-containing protein [Daedaleopsis nitida]